jgi:hypothetical protein
MRFSRRNFLKAAGSGVALTAIQGQAMLKGKTLSTDLHAPAMAAALANAAPLKYNASKVDMAKGLLASGLNRIAGAS